MPDLLTIASFATGIVGSIFGGIAGSQQSPKEKASADILADLQGMEDIFTDLPFTKEEVMNQLLPQVQQLYRGAADIVAGKIGAQTGEAGIAAGQGAKDFFLQSIAPVIAQGEQLAAGAVGDFAGFFARLSENQKGQLLNFYQTQIGAAEGLPDMTTLQSTITGALGGLQIGANIGGDIAETSVIGDQAEVLQGIIDKLDEGGIKKASASITTGVTSTDSTNFFK